MQPETTDSPLTRVMALHALAYCERLFFLEEVEEIRVADANVYAGRRLHEELVEDEALETHQIADAELGLVGKMDAIRKRGGELYPYEHKRGRSNKGEAWTSDRIQVGAYAMLLERELHVTIKQARIRYHRDKKTVILTVDDALRLEVKQAVQRANELRESTERPPITTNEYLCTGCSLAPVCLPEETRKAKDRSYEPARLFPPKQEKQTIHVLGHGEKIGRHGETVKIQPKDGKDEILPIEDIREIVIHGYAQMTTQALSLCAYHEIPVHYISTGGHYQFCVHTGTGGVQRRIHQYAFFADIENSLQTAKQTVLNRMENQYQFLMRQSRDKKSLREEIQTQLRHIQKMKEMVNGAENIDTLRGFEGNCGSAYFSALQAVVRQYCSEPFHFQKRTRRPPKDRFNAILSFGYSLLYRSVYSAILVVGLEPALGYYHTPRSAAHPLILDVMELFRVPIWDVSVLSSLRRNLWHPDDDFAITPGQVWLSDNGRRKAVEFFENRLNETWKHPVLDYSLSYSRQIELEVRLLEKTWTEGKSLFAQSTLR